MSAATDARAGMRSNCADMERQPFYRWIEETYPLHIMASAVALYAWGGFPYVVWGLAVRAVWVWHITWAVNSVSHVWGNQPWKTGDESRNNWLIGILAFGEASALVNCHRVHTRARTRTTRARFLSLLVLSAA